MGRLIEWFYVSRQNKPHQLLVSTKILLFRISFVFDFRENYLYGSVFRIVVFLFERCRIDHTRNLVDRGGDGVAEIPFVSYQKSRLIRLYLSSIRAIPCGLIKTSVDESECIIDILIRNQYLNLYKIEIFSNLKKLRFELEIA